MKSGEWNSLLLEIYGNEMVASINDDLVLLGKADGVDVEKPRLSLVASGSHGWFDELTIWDAELNPSWAKEKRK